MYFHKEEKLHEKKREWISKSDLDSFLPENTKFHVLYVYQKLKELFLFSSFTVHNLKALYELKAKIKTFSGSKEAVPITGNHCLLWLVDYNNPLKPFRVLINAKCFEFISTSWKL